MSARCAPPSSTRRASRRSSATSIHGPSSPTCSSLTGLLPSASPTAMGAPVAMGPRVATGTTSVWPTPCTRRCAAGTRSFPSDKASRSISPASRTQVYTCPSWCSASLTKKPRRYAQCFVASRSGTAAWAPSLASAATGLAHGGRSSSCMDMARSRRCSLTASPPRAAWIISKRVPSRRHPAAMTPLAKLPMRWAVILRTDSMTTASTKKGSAAGRRLSARAAR
mmetsp:Transcript_7274/g.22508  ORF Transcript_7274/g.22508 Transcript_7274/m.22508 type:complete len:224 (-) Transcript_7274:1324-1995(-)